jgi:hypothetical protein
MKMADEMLTDMKLSSSNAGLPRLHIKITQPDIAPNEDQDRYTDRINDYFDATVEEFTDIGPDDNFYTWDDVKIETIGAQGPGGFVFRANRQVIDEEIIAAWHLYPWVLGKSASTTKNWVNSQFDLLLAEAESLQKEAKRFAEWIRNVELALKGINNVQVHHEFERPRDPSFKDMQIAQRFKINNVRTKVQMGTISPDDGARELGYDKAFKPDLVYKMKGAGEYEPINKESAEEDRLEEIEQRVETLEIKDNENADDHPDSERGVSVRPVGHTAGQG